MVRDKEHGDLTDAELDAVAGGKMKQEAKKLEAEANAAGFLGYVFGKGVGGADTLSRRGAD
jgi:hypothetical protein